MRRDDALAYFVRDLAHYKKVKILGNGELTKKFTVKVPCSASAKAKIEKAGGTVA